MPSDAPRLTVPTVEWLRTRTDVAIAELLAARPDLMVPAPPDLDALARRMDTAATVRRAIAACTAFHLRLLQALGVLADGTTAASTTTDDAGSADQAGVTSPSVAHFLGGPASVTEVQRGLEHLHTVGLVRKAHNANDVFALAAATGVALGPFPGGLAPVGAHPLGPAEVDRALAAADPASLALLQKLVPGPPIGSAPADSPHRAALASLIEAGLLTDRGDGTVLLPREVALALRGRHPLGPVSAEPPTWTTRQLAHGTVDGAAGGRALATHALAAALLTALGVDGVPALKSGGIGTVPLRALAKSVDAEIRVVALHLELLHACGLIAPALDRGRAGAVWLPTQTADMFLNGSETAGWALVASAWLDLRRDPSRIGGKDAAGKSINALSVQADWRGGPAQRRRVLRELMALDADTAVEQPDLVARLEFFAPLAEPGALSALVDGVTGEATELGLVAFGALAAPGRAIVEGDVEQAAAALEQALPAPIDKVLVQADMTIIAPGRLTQDLAAALAEIADVESAGSATVYRLSETSVRRGLDLGVTAAEIRELLARHAATAVPQSVSYLIDDVARRHGVLRAGHAGAVVHSEDPTLITTAMTAAAAAGIPMRALAPTVAVSPVDLETLIEALRAAGLGPAAEDAAGDLLDLTPAPRRTRAASPVRTPFAEPSAPAPEQIEAVVRRMRAGDRMDGPGASDPRDLVPLLRAAQTARSAVWITYSDAEGSRSTRAVEPLVVSGGTMVAFDRLRNAPRTFVLARISSAHPA